ncbi:DUF2147 domain-containing protein [Acinetobacter junii]|jgi:uncharacterized protein (DUF2147 family)|uniref:DUF2147 domain-containing protein n=1 Tax=Acinetobacter junii CIP 107470 = MTCC 11364 TaxID=1217666 RepID=S7XXU2_ACIJU|nr:MULTISPECIES: DUF2147 domain-containing protein [Acinetobacter]APU47711.1 signal peptidase [Acinetobacter junii]AWA47031.1 DUF2147 domain-containing protein [Acinetobacter junii]ENV51629.1 hypothetical protein F953_00946 [Acinetobacter junii CIP 107470 = MTCC 11364]ENV65966.1 hypothetical protein F948_02478 [Acinetobacter junii CIP 64.5]EPR83849.1 hypothetical protein L292_0400 [Acinetobacter junii CIP 107470 = MTCC 11364]
MYKKGITFFILFSLGHFAFAQDITGIWQSIDDLTGAPKGQVEITQEADGTYTGKITKITPRTGYTPKEFCTGCPAPYTNKPIVGLNVITKLKHKRDLTYTGGRILDPNTGRVYSLAAKLSSNGQRLHLRGYVGVSVLGRSQIWIRVNNNKAAE